MSRKAVLFTWILMVIGAAPGCKHCDSGCAPTTVEEIEDGQIVKRTRIAPDADVLAPALNPVMDERTYWAGTPQEIQCRAAEKSGTADMMEKEYKSLDNQNCLTRNSKNTQMKKTILRHSSVEARNVDAGTALELYYRLAELEAKSDIARDSLAIVAEGLVELKKLKQQGLKVPPDYAALQKQQLEIAADLGRAQLGIQQINGELARLLNWHSLGLRGYLWPVDSFNVTQTEEDPEAAVEVGMTHRAQLTLIRAVRDDVDAKSLPSLLLLLRAYNGFLGMSRTESFVSFMGGALPGTKQKDLASRRQQMDEMLKEQEFVVAQEIRQAIYTIRTKTHLVALSKEKISTAQEKLKDLQDKKQRGLASVLDVSAQTLNVSHAQAELIQETMAWHTARAKLKQAQGLLACECGYTPEHPWNEVDPTCPDTTSGTLAPPQPENEAPEMLAPPQRGTLLPPVPIAPADDS